MFFAVTNTNNTVRYIRTTSNAKGDEMAERLLQLRKLKKIKNFERIDFENLKPDELFIP